MKGPSDALVASEAGLALPGGSNAFGDYALAAEFVPHMPPGGHAETRRGGMVRCYCARPCVFIFSPCRLWPFAVPALAGSGVRPSRIELRDWEEPKLDAADQSPAKH